MNGLQVGDVVALNDGFGNNWTGGIITMIHPKDGVYVRWPDTKVGIFEHRHAKCLVKETA